VQATPLAQTLTLGFQVTSDLPASFVHRYVLHGKSYVSEPKYVMRCENTGRITCVISERDVVASGSAG
jgi:hypothetical protein